MWNARNLDSMSVKNFIIFGLLSLTQIYVSTCDTPFPPQSQYKNRKPEFQSQSGNSSLILFGIRINRLWTRPQKVPCKYICICMEVNRPNIDLLLSSVILANFEFVGWVYIQDFCIIVLLFNIIINVVPVSTHNQ